MERNIGNLDKFIRISIALIFIALYATDRIKGTLGYVLIGFAVILLFTSLINFCPIYTFLGWNSHTKKKE